LSKTVLIIGGYGVFGGRLAAWVAKHGQFDIIVAGRSLSTAEKFCAKHGGRPMAMDRASPRVCEVIAAVAPSIVVDATGPYQTQDYRIARAATACGAHYLDLSDAAEFTKGISALDAEARNRGVAVLSGVSSVPALSSAVVDALASDIADVHLIEIVVLPGNKAPRGLSVVQSILTQAGNPLPLWRGGEWTTTTGWSETREIILAIPGCASLAHRWASFIGAPDLLLFPDRYRARSVLFRAGLELKFLHGGLSVLSRLVRIGVLGSLLPVAPALKWIADRVESLGTDRGGMRVRVAGKTNNGDFVGREWTLIAEAGDGPQIPTVAARVMCSKLALETVASGAAPCLGKFTLAQAEATMKDLRVATHSREYPVTPLLIDVLGGKVRVLPEPLRELHAVIDRRTWSGEAVVTRGRGLLVRCIAAMMGFPPAGQKLAVTVSMQREGASEIWRRDFGGHRFRSQLSRAGPVGSGRLRERFGILSFEMELRIERGRLFYPVRRASALGLRLPRILLPSTDDAHEYVDEAGRARFDIAIRLPFLGALVRYSGWLVPRPAKSEVAAPARG
jgi:saccharopine dehydrogenase-like NADP-dependent oxidoreductase